MQGLKGWALSLCQTRTVTPRVMTNLITIINDLIMHQVGWLIKSKPYRRVSMQISILNLFFSPPAVWAHPLLPLGLSSALVVEPSSLLTTFQPAVAVDSPPRWARPHAILLFDRVVSHWPSPSSNRWSSPWTSLVTGARLTSMKSSTPPSESPHRCQPPPLLVSFIPRNRARRHPLTTPVFHAMTAHWVGRRWARSGHASMSARWPQPGTRSALHLSSRGIGSPGWGLFGLLVGHAWKAAASRGM
jgi:hypothetical protein